MTTAKTQGVPDGLPERFTEPDVGFRRLCEFLEIANRAQQQRILNTDGVKNAVRPRKTEAQKLSDAKRRRMLLTFFYGLAGERRILWRYIQNAKSDVPSLEYHALRNYDADFAEHAFDEERIAEALAEFPNAVELSPTWWPGSALPWQSGPTFGRNCLSGQHSTMPEKTLWSSLCSLLQRSSTTQGFFTGAENKRTP